MKSKILPIVTATWLAVSLAGCASRPSSAPTPPGSAEAVLATPREATHTPLAAPTATPTPVATFTPAPTPTAPPTPTTTPTSVATRTPTPTATAPPTPTPMPPTPSATSPSYADQSLSRTPITPANAAQVTQLAQLGGGWLTNLAWSPNGDTLALASSVGVWLVDPGAPDAPPRLLAVRGGGPALSVAFSPDGRSLAAAGQRFDLDYYHGGWAWVWDVASGEMLGAWEQPELRLSLVAFAPDGSLLAVGVEANTAHVWRLDLPPAGAGGQLTASQLSALGPNAEIQSMAFNADATRLVVGGGSLGAGRYQPPPEAHWTRLWEVASGQELAVLETIYRVNFVAISPPAGLVATTNVQGLQLWQGDTGGALATLPRGLGPMTFSPDESQLAYAARVARGDFSHYFYDDVQLHLYDLASGSDRSITPVLSERIRSLAFSPDGASLAVVSEDERGEQIVRLFEAASGLERAVLTSWPGQMRNASFSPDEGLIVASSYESLRVWDVASGTQVLNVPIDDVGEYLGGSGLYAISPDDSLVAAVAPPDRATINVWDLRTGQQVATLSGYGDQVDHLAFSPDGRFLAAASEWESGVRLWEVADWAEWAVLEGEGSLSFSPQGSVLAVSGHDQVHVYSMESGESLGILKGDFAQEPYAVHFSPDTLASQGTGKQLMLYGRGEWRTMRDLETGTDLYRVPGRWREVFSPDGRLAAIQGLHDPNLDGSRVILWETSSGRAQAIFEVPEADYFTRIAFSPDTPAARGTGGRLLLAEEFSGRTSIWEVESRTLLATLEHGGVFNPGGTLLAGAGRDGYIHLWDTATWTELFSLPGHNGRFDVLAFNADGTLLLTGGADGALRLWGIPIE